MRRRPCWLAGAALLFCAPLLTHDFWIEPSSFRPEVGSVIGVRLFVGQKFRGEALPRNPAMILRFALVSDAGETLVAGRAADEPAGAVRIERPGLELIAFRSRDSRVSLEPAKFEEYLREEGLEYVIEARTRRGQSQKPSRELFSRSAKSLISAGEGGTTGYDRLLGSTLELVPEQNPYAMREGEELPVRLLYEGRPLSGALVSALPHEDPDRRLSQRSDGDGRVTFRIGKAGAWLVKAVHMVPVSDDPSADWRSIWASLTFEIPASAPIGSVP